MNYRLLLVSCTLSAMSGGCVYEPPTGILAVINERSESYYIYETCDSLRFDMPIRYYNEPLPTMTDANGNPISVSKYPFYRADKGDTVFLHGYGRPDNKKSFCGDGKVILYFISDDDMKEKNWKEIVDYQIYDYKITLTENELDETHWIYNLR